MKKVLLTYILATICSIAVFAQGQVKGHVLDKSNSEALSFVNVTLIPQGSTKMMTGCNTDVNGRFNLQKVKYGTYTLTLTFVGYKTVKKQVVLSSKNPSVSFAAIYMTEDSHALQEVEVTGQRSAMKLEVDRKSFDVAGMIGNAGMSASEVLENVPSVEVDNDGNISLRGNSSVEVWINGRASGLTSDNQAQILQQIPAETIDRIEVIDNPSAKFSAEGSAGIINIILKKDRKAGYYGSIQAGGDTRAGARTSFNINYSSKKLDAYLNVGYRHRENLGTNESTQNNLTNGIPTSYERHSTSSSNIGNNLFTRAGLTWHATGKDDLGLSGMFMTGKRNDSSNTPYYIGNYTAQGEQLTETQWRDTHSGGPMRMFYGEFAYRHNFSDKHFINLTASHMQWKSDDDNIYQDRYVFVDPTIPVATDYLYRPLYINNREEEVKLEYENQITDKFKLEAGYNGTFSHENTPQQSYTADDWEGTQNYQEDQLYFNRFIYDLDIHAFYTTLSYKFGKFTAMGGLRGEYWKVNTQSDDWYQEHGLMPRDEPFKKDYFQLFPSIFTTYQITKTQQLQLNYTRRLRRPHGGELNSFCNTSDASITTFGNPELTPEYSHSLALNYLKTWEQHSLLVSGYYRPTTDVIQRINYRSIIDGQMYQTPENVAKSLSTGLEITAKNKLFRILDLTTNVNLYYYKLDDFNFDIDGQTVTGKGQESFTWNARVIASFKLPYDITIQANAKFNSRQTISQGYRPARCSLDLGIRKNFFNRMFTLSINCRDVFNSKKWESYTSSDSFERYQLNKRRSRTINFTLTWNFGNSKSKKKRGDNQQQDDEDSGSMGNSYDSGGGE